MQGQSEKIAEELWKSNIPLLCKQLKAELKFLLCIFLPFGLWLICFLIYYGQYDSQCNNNPFESKSLHGKKYLSPENYYKNKSTNVVWDLKKKKKHPKDTHIHNKLHKTILCFLQRKIQVVCTLKAISWEQNNNQMRVQAHHHQSYYTVCMKHLQNNGVFLTWHRALTEGN